MDEDLPRFREKEKIGHNWSGSPGMYCMTCGNDSPLESTFLCPDCEWSGGLYGVDNHTPCAFHFEWKELMLQCPPDKGKVQAFNEKWFDKTNPH